jgi:hypothetical protein
MICHWPETGPKWVQSDRDLKCVSFSFSRLFYLYATHTLLHPTHTLTPYTHTHTNLLQIEPLTFTYLQRNFFQEQATSLNLKGFFSKKNLDEKKVGVALFDAHGETSRPAVWDKWNRQTHSSMQIEIWKTPLLLLKFYFKKS